MALKKVIHGFILGYVPDVGARCYGIADIVT